MNMCGNVRAIFVEILWRRRDFPSVDCHRRWNIGASLWTCKEIQSIEWKHIIAQDQEIQKCTFCQQSDVYTVLELQWASLIHSFLYVDWENCDFSWAFK